MICGLYFLAGIGFGWMVVGLVVLGLLFISRAPRSKIDFDKLDESL